MAEISNLIPIKEGDLLAFAKKAEADLNEVEWAPKKSDTASTTKGTPVLLGPALSGANSSQKMSIVKVAREFCGGDIILSDNTHHVLSVLKTAIQLGMHLETLYVKSSGLDVLEKQNSARTLPESQQAEFNAKQTTRSALALYSMASYVVWELAGYRVEEVSSVSLETPTIIECPLTSTIPARRCALYYLGRGLSDDAISTDLAFVKYTLLYFRAIIAEIKLREGGFQFTEPFTDRKYKLEDSEFVIDGWKEQGDRSVVSVEFNRVLFTDIVGNRIAKHNSMRMIARLLCYDPLVKKNPMKELGGLAPIRLGQGEPGTGKSMLIAAIATDLDERSKWLKIPFLFHPLPDAIVSTYQGGSAERMMTWMSALKDPSKLIYAPIDDAENSFENRTRQGVSSGVREVISVFLRNTEGAYAVNYGNTLIDVCTNLPEQIDPAVMSRIVERYAIRGAESSNDFIDQDHAWWQKYMSYSRTFIDMDDPNGYTYFADQKVMTSITKDGERYTKAQNSSIEDILQKTLKSFNPKSQSFFGALYRNVKDVFPGFTSRDVRNIQSAVTSRILDFDFPVEWLDDPKHFFGLEYDVKKSMLVELLAFNMKGISFHEIRMEESLRYLDNMASIVNVDFERQVNQLVKSERIHQEAKRRLTASAG